MFNFIYRRWLIAKRIREYEREALAHEFEASEVFLEIRNAKGLIDAEKSDIEANGADIKQDEFEIDRCKKYTDDELFEFYKDKLLHAAGPDSQMEPNQPTPEMMAKIRKDNNETISQLQQEVKNLKAANDNARESIKQREMELRGVIDRVTGKVVKQGYNTKYQGHIVASQRARIHAHELRKFLKKSQKSKIKLADG